MRANALLKLLIGGAGGLVLAVSSVQCQPGVDDPVSQIVKATGAEAEPLMGDYVDFTLDWQWPYYIE